jgi:hypothetical protein
MRQCGECTLCCTLLPVVPLGKGAGERCKYQRRAGCRVYNKPKMPLECQQWNCRWLVNEAGDTRRPDLTHYVIDVMPDFITTQETVISNARNIEVIQIWVDSQHPDAWRDPELLAFLELRGKEGKAALIRYNSKDGFVLVPPAMAGDGDFHEVHHGKSIARTHSFAEVVKALGGEIRIETMEDEHG